MDRPTLSGIIPTEFRAVIVGPACSGKTSVVQACVSTETRKSLSPSEATILDEWPLKLPCNQHLIIVDTGGIETFFPLTMATLQSRVDVLIIAVPPPWTNMGEEYITAAIEYNPNVVIIYLMTKCDQAFTYYNMEHPFSILMMDVDRRLNRVRTKHPGIPMKHILVSTKLGLNFDVLIDQLNEIISSICICGTENDDSFLESSRSAPPTFNLSPASPRLRGGCEMM